MIDRDRGQGRRNWCPCRRRRAAAPPAPPDGTAGDIGSWRVGSSHVRRALRQGGGSRNEPERAADCPSAASGTAALATTRRTAGVRHTMAGWCRWPCRCPRRADAPDCTRSSPARRPPVWTRRGSAAATATGQRVRRSRIRVWDECYRRPRPPQVRWSVSGRRGHPDPPCWTAAVLLRTLPDTSAVAVRDAIQAPDTADERPRPVSARRGAVATGNGRRVGGRWWDVASAGGRGQAGRSGGRGAGRGHRSWPAG
jgi:hypothetical protein